MANRQSRQKREAYAKAQALQQPVCPTAPWGFEPIDAGPMHADGTIAAMKVKARATLNQGDFDPLRAPRDQLVYCFRLGV